MERITALEELAKTHLLLFDTSALIRKSGWVEEIDATEERNLPIEDIGKVTQRYMEEIESAVLLTNFLKTSKNGFYCTARVFNEYKPWHNYAPGLKLKASNDEKYEVLLSLKKVKKSLAKNKSRLKNEIQARERIVDATGYPKNYEELWARNTGLAMNFGLGSTDYDLLIQAIARANEGLPTCIVSNDSSIYKALDEFSKGISIRQRVRLPMFAIRES